MNADNLKLQSDINRSVSLCIEGIGALPEKTYSAADMLRYAAEIRAHERERSAVVAESIAPSEYLGKGSPSVDRNHEIIKLASIAAAAAIRSGR